MNFNSLGSIIEDKPLKWQTLRSNLSTSITAISKATTLQKRFVRAGLQEIAKKHNANIQIAELQAGPPVLAPIVAEVYGPPLEKGRIQFAKHLERLFNQVPDMVDIDTYIAAEGRS